jgi:hypothetical protein
MSFDDRYKPENHHYKHFNKHFDNHNKYDPQDCYLPGHPSKIRYIMYILRRIWGDRRLRIYLIVSLVIVKIVLVFLVILIAPLLNDLGDIIRQDGLKGIVGNVAELLGKFWNGASGSGKII